MNIYFTCVTVVFIYITMRFMCLVLIFTFCAVNAFDLSTDTNPLQIFQELIKIVCNQFNIRRPDQNQENQSKESVLVSNKKPTIVQTGQLLPTESKENNNDDIRRTYFVQDLDHFADEKTQWNQIVFVNEKYYKSGGPVFIYLSSFQEQYDRWLEGSELTNMAEELGGLIYVIVPRYFNDSRPTTDLSTENLQYLTVEQNLADYSKIINYLKNNLAKLGTKSYIAAGFDVAGLITLTLHQSYPGLLTGVLAYSAITEIKYDFPEYFGHIFNFLSSSDAPDGCGDNLNDAILQLEELYKKSDGDGIQKIFNTLEPVNTKNNYEISYFYSTIGNIISSVLEYGNLQTIEKFCSTLAIKGVPELQKLGLFVKALKPTGVQGSYKKNVEINTNTDWDSETAITGSRQLSYIGCNQFSWHKTSSLIPNIETRIPVDYYTKRCRDVFGEDITEKSIKNANKNSKSKYSLKRNLKNVFFSHGNLNPFHLVGITKDLNSDSPAILYQNYGKAADLPKVTPPDATQLTEGKRVARLLVKKWIGWKE